MSDEARTAGPITPERFVNIVTWTRSVMDAVADRNNPGAVPPSSMEPVERTARLVRHGMIADGIAPDWLLAEDWDRRLPW